MTDSSEFLDKPLPSNTDAEKIVLGSILLDQKCFDLTLSIVDPSDFYSPMYRHMFTAMINVQVLGQSIDPITMSEYFKSQDITFIPITEITGLTIGLPHFSHSDVSNYATLIKEHSVARRLIRLCNETMYNAIKGEENIKTLLEPFESQVLTLTSSVNNRDKKIEKPFSDLGELVPELHQQFHNYHYGITNGVKTGMREVDEVLDGGGLQGGGVYLVAAAAKTGKTSLALDWIYDITAVQKAGTALVATGEMSKVTLAKRIYSAHTGIPYYRFRPGLYDTHDDKTYTKALNELTRFGTIPISISDNLMTIGQIKRHFRRQVEAGHKSNDPKKKIVVGMVDYLQLVGLDNSKGSRTEEVEKVSRELKLLAMELDIPIIEISSMNRIGMEAGNVPDTYNLRQSGSIEFDAEAIFFLHNPAYIPGQPYEPQEVTPMNLILARQRNGPSRNIPVMFIGPYMQFMTVNQYERNRGSTDNDEIVPQSQGQMLLKEEDDMKLWEN